MLQNVSSYNEKNEEKKLRTILQFDNFTMLEHK